MLSNLFSKYLTHKFALPDAIALALELQSTGLKAQGDLLLAYACRLEGNHVLLQANPWTNGRCYIAPLPPIGRLKDEDIWFDTVELSPYLRFKDYWLPLFPVYRWQYEGFVEASNYATASRNIHQPSSEHGDYSNFDSKETDLAFILGLSALEIVVYCHWFQKSPFVPPAEGKQFFTRQLTSTKIILAVIPPQWENQGRYFSIDLSSEMMIPSWLSIPIHTSTSSDRSFQNQYLPIHNAAFATMPDADLMQSSTNRISFPMRLTISEVAPRPLPLISRSMEVNQRLLSESFQAYLASNFSLPTVDALVNALAICNLHTYACCLQIFFADKGKGGKIFEVANRLFSSGTTFISFTPPTDEAKDNDAWFDLTELSPYIMHAGTWYPLKPVYWWQYQTYISCSSHTKDIVPSASSRQADKTYPLQQSPSLPCDTPIDRITLPEAIAYAAWFGKAIFDPLTGPDKNAPFSTLLQPGWRLWSAVNFDEQQCNQAMAFDQSSRRLTYELLTNLAPTPPASAVGTSAQVLFHPAQRHEKITFATAISNKLISKPPNYSFPQFAPRPIPQNLANDKNISLQLGLAFCDYLRNLTDRSTTEQLCSMLEIAGFEKYSRLLHQYAVTDFPALPIKAKENPWTAAHCYLGSSPPDKPGKDCVWFDIIELAPAVFSGQRWIPLQPVYNWQFIGFLHCCEYEIYDGGNYQYCFYNFDDKPKLLKSLSHVFDPLSPVINIKLDEACAYARWFHKQLFDPFMFTNSITEAQLPDTSLRYLTDIFPAFPTYGTMRFDISNNQLLSDEEILSADLHPSQISIYHCYQPHDVVFATCPDIVTGRLIPLNFEEEKAKKIGLRNQVIRKTFDYQCF